MLPLRRFRGAVKLLERERPIRNGEAQRRASSKGLALELGLLLALVLGGWIRIVVVVASTDVLVAHPHFLAGIARHARGCLVSGRHARVRIRAHCEATPRDGKLVRPVVPGERAREGL